MSVRMMTLVWELELPDSEKLVLLALADCANDEGHCWPGMKTLTRKCSKTDRTVQLAVKMLCVKGHLTRREVPGKGCNYTVHPIIKLADPRTGFTPEVASPPKGTTQTPEAASGKPSKTVKSEAKASSSGKTLIPEDWTPPQVSELPPRARACAEQWSDASYQTEGEAHLLYWRSERKMKADWHGTWANRIIARHSAVMRDQKFGNAPPELRKPAKQLNPAEQRAYAERFAANLESQGRLADAEEYRRRSAVSLGNAAQSILRAANT